MLALPRLLATLLLRLMSSIRVDRLSPYSRADPSAPSLQRPMYALLISPLWSSRLRWLKSRFTLPSNANASTRLVNVLAISALDRESPNLEALTRVSAVTVIPAMAPTSAFCVRCDFTSRDFVCVDSLSQISALTLAETMLAQFLGARHADNFSLSLSSGKRVVRKPDTIFASCASISGPTLADAA